MFARPRHPGAVACSSGITLYRARTYDRDIESERARERERDSETKRKNVHLESLEVYGHSPNLVQETCDKDNVVPNPEAKPRALNDSEGPEDIIPVPITGT